MEEKKDSKYLKLSWFCDTGKIRSENEDSFYIEGEDIRKDACGRAEGQTERSLPTAFAVFDGMGGEAFGGELSQIAAECFGLQLEGENVRDIREWIAAFGRMAEEQIWGFLELNGGRNGGTTYAGAWVNEDALTAFWRGDSRVYLYAGGMLKRLTRDHTVAWREIEAGNLTEKEAKNTRGWHMLTRFLGDGGNGLPEFSEAFVKPGDKILICSDGLTDLCEDEEIEQILAENGPEAAARLGQAALLKGGHDNVTVLVGEVSA